MLNTSDFEYIAKLVKKEAGITLEAGKEYLVQSRVEPLAKSLGFADIASFVGSMQKSTDSTRQRLVVESITTHETSFFRDIEPFEAIRTKVIPEIMERQKISKEFTIWCGAASSGQEPYSMCMLLKENFPELVSWKVRFIATDVSNAILEKARLGTFNQIEVNRGLPIRLLAKYFEKKGQEWIIKSEIREMVKFSELNLLQPLTIIPKADLILLRNVMIYFDVETKKQILNKMLGILKPRGFLFLGAAETTLSLSDGFDRVSYERTSCYRKKES